MWAGPTRCFAPNRNCTYVFDKHCIGAGNGHGFCPVASATGLDTCRVSNASSGTGHWTQATPAGNIVPYNICTKTKQVLKK